jgi:hypothetical protein
MVFKAELQIPLSRAYDHRISIKYELFAERLFEKLERIN